MKKRILSLVLTICMVLSLMPITAFGESGKHTVTVNAGENGKVSTDGTSWSDSVEVIVNDGETLNGKVQYKADDGYGVYGVVPNLSMNIVSVAADGYHTVLLDENNNVRTAGRNDKGQLGRETSSDSDSTFTHVTDGISGVNITAMAAGEYHTVLLDANGNVWTAGYNSTFAQVTVSNGVKIKAIAAGGYHTVLLDENNNVWTAGGNDQGQLGRETSSNSDSTFTQVTDGISGVNITAIAAGGYHTVLLDTNGNVWTAGYNYCGQLGRDENNGSYKANSTFKKVTVGDGVKIKAIAAGGNHTVLLDVNNNVWTAGENNHGQLGSEENIGTGNANPTFKQVTKGIDGVKITAIAAGLYHTVLLDKDGNVWSAGYNRYGQLGREENIGTNNANPTFKQVTKGIDGVNITTIAAGRYHTVLLDKDGNVWTAGNNGYGQLGREENIGTDNANPTFAQATVNPDAITFEEWLNTPIYNDSEFIVKFKVKYETVYLRTTDGGSEWSFQNNFSQSYHVDSTTIDFRDFSNSVFRQNGWSLDWGYPEIYVQSGDWTLLPATDSEINCSIDGGSLTVQYENGQTYPGGCANVSDGATLNIQGDGISESWEISTLRVTGIYAGTVRFISGTVIHA
ncbi:MAG: RCC1 domain-containing protein, partial [Eubacterium sp.]